MKYKDLDPDEVFFFDDNFDYPKVKTESGHKDLRDNVTGSMPDDYEVVSVHDLTSERYMLRDELKDYAEFAHILCTTNGLTNHDNVKFEKCQAVICRHARAALDKAKG